MMVARATATVLALAVLVAACGGGEGAVEESASGERTAGASMADESSTDLAAPAPPALEEQGPQAPRDVTFADHGVGGFVSTADLAASTFRTDADVASFRLAQAWIERRGLLPPSEAVRAEEWVNALDHRYPDPEGGGTFRVTADAGAPWWHAPAGAPQDTVLLRVGVQAAHDVPRAPASVTLVVDTSGSMDTDDRIGTVVRAAGDLLDRLEPRDQVGVVAFADSAHVVVEHTNDHAAVREALAGLVPEGSTNTGAGVVLGFEQAAARARDGDHSSVVLFADGAANRGTTAPDAILDQLDEGIVLHSVGVGLEVYNDALLERLANARSGTYAYVDLPEHAADLFERDLPVLAPVARDVKAQVAFDPAAVSAWRLVGYENRLIEADAFRDDTVAGGFVGAGHAVTALYELVVDRESGAPADTLAAVSVRWTEPRSGAVDEVTAELPSALLDGGTGSTTFGTAAAMAALAEELRGSPHAVVDLAQVAAQLDATGDEQDAWLAGVVRSAAAAAQVSSPERREVAPPGVRVEDRTP